MNLEKAGEQLASLTALYPGVCEELSDLQKYIANKGINWGCAGGEAACFSLYGAANSHYLAATARLMCYSLISGSTSLARFFSNSCHPR